MQYSSDNGSTNFLPSSLFSITCAETSDDPSMDTIKHGDTHKIHV